MAKKKQKEEQVDWQAKAQEFEQGWKRALADYENLQRDMAAGAEKSRQMIKKSFAQDLLPVIDNFAQAVKFAPDESKLPDEFKPWMQGIMYIEKQFEAVMGSLGVEPIPASGQFDAHMHEAAETKSNAEQPDGAVLEVLQPGWKMGDYVLRPAKVVVNEIDADNAEPSS